MKRERKGRGIKRESKECNFSLINISGMEIFLGKFTVFLNIHVKVNRKAKK